MYHGCGGHGVSLVADILLWKDKNLSAAILVAFTIIWFLFEVVEYNFVTLLSHLSIIMMLIVFIWFNGAGIMNWNPPDIRDIKVPESTFRWLFTKINWLLLTLYEISCWEDLAMFLLAIAFLWILSVIGSYFSSLNLFYIGFLCMETLPALYERYEKEVDHLASHGNRDVKKLYKKFDSRVLNKIPRGPVKEKKFK
ncbi:hypothetical protein F0562_034090 [Nyssa sinensis]|uniref:Reticulon-like protein n=1 Tax=Nyssa sinensis TaxID=561372 RepID=A0A5J5AIY5_9ASTE|nr:hypothetical protein F0562_034090 [Nyssa sinensis]